MRCIVKFNFLAFIDWVSTFHYIYSCVNISNITFKEKYSKVRWWTTVCNNETVCDNLLQSVARMATLCNNNFFCYIASPFGLHFGTNCYIPCGDCTFLGNVWGQKIKFFRFLLKIIAFVSEFTCVWFPSNSTFNICLILYVGKLFKNKITQCIFAMFARKPNIFITYPSYAYTKE